jgi:hypothetical protein
LRQDLRKIRGDDNDNYEGVLYSKGGAPAYLANKHINSSNVVVSHIEDDRSIYRISQNNQDQVHLQRLIEDKEQLIIQGYSKNDPLIMTMD